MRRDIFFCFGRCFECKNAKILWSIRSLLPIFSSIRVIIVFVFVFFSRAFWRLLTTSLLSFSNLISGNVLDFVLFFFCSVSTYCCFYFPLSRQNMWVSCFPIISIVLALSRYLPQVLRDGYDFLSPGLLARAVLQSQSLEFRFSFRQRNRNGVLSSIFLSISQLPNTKKNIDLKLSLDSRLSRPKLQLFSLF